MKKFLSVPYFRSADPERQKELDACVKGNAANPAIDRMYLFIDDGHEPPVKSKKFIILPIGERLTYGRWLDFVAGIGEEHIAILANTDILFDETVARFDDVLKRRNRVVALSRFDRKNGALEPHPNPRWSQDVWALNSWSDITPELKKAADFPLGVPRCDNKIVYVFAVHGWDLINPFPVIRSIHLHESNIRNYDKEKDRTLIGGMGFIQPQQNFLADSKVELTIWPRKTEQISNVRLVNALEQWDRRDETLRREEPIRVLDRNWQYPAITEQWAYEHIRKAKDLISEGCVYLGFPWATLIDLLANKRAEADGLESELRRLAARFRGKRRVVTVCQHIKMLRHQDLFYNSGVTDIFWSHAVRGQERLPDYPAVRIRPFPLYPVQVKSEVADEVERPILFSFIGARAKHFYLTQSRNYIIDLLSEDPRGLVIGRDDWHYNKVVYDHQIKKNVTDRDKLIDEAASAEFQKSLKESVFSLCPSGSGPNSIRLWESIGAGAIPVILADTWALPGNPALWEEACVFCQETADAIAALPDRLETLAADEALLARKRHAARQLWRLYGPDWFVYDIERLFLSCADEAADDRGRLPISVANLVCMAQSAAEGDRNAGGAFVLNAVTSRMLIDADSFSAVWRATPRLRASCDKIAGVEPESALARSFDAVRKKLETRTPRQPAPAARKKLRVARFGRNSTRTPIAYPAYAPLFAREFDYASCLEDADVVVFGASPNIKEHAEEVGALLARNQKPRLVVVSEEPLWDTTWSCEIFDARKSIEILGEWAEYAVLNHFTSPIFDFEKIPYFVTTTDDYFLRYSNLFRRNAALKPKALLVLWEKALWRAAFYAERRHGDNYDFRQPDKDLYGLCAYRTRVAEAVTGEGVVRVGQRWSEGVKRQELADWHLDKLVALDRRSYVVSGLENTHQSNYLTEKIFDAFAVLGAPLYYASAAHRIRGVVSESAYINLFGKTVHEAAEIIAGFEPDISFAEAYLDAQRQLSLLFSKPETLINERRRVVSEVVRALEALQK